MKVSLPSNNRMPVARYSALQEIHLSMFRQYADTSLVRGLIAKTVTAWLSNVNSIKDLPERPATETLARQRDDYRPSSATADRVEAVSGCRRSEERRVGNEWSSRLVG